MTETSANTNLFQPSPTPVSVRLAKKLLPEALLRYVRRRGEVASQRITIVSFYTEGGYYEEKANELRARCDELGMLHDIQPITFPEGTSWSEICRAKVRFYRKMLLKHRSTIMWVDVDTKLLRNVDNLASRAYDIAAFMRGFRFLPQENFSLYARRFHPGYLILNYTRETLELLYECKRVERETEGDFTDDYILEEAFRRTSARPRLLVLSPNDVVRPQDSENPGAYFLHGDSGNVKEFKGKVLQHTPDIMRPESQKAVILDLISDAARAGRRTLVCDYFHALLSRDPEDYASYHRLLEISAKFKDPSVLKANLARYRDNEHLHPYALRFQLLQAIDQKAWARADELFSEILLTGNEAVISFSRSRLFRASLDRRAEQRGIEPSRRVKLFWWEQPYPGNLGDIVNPYIVEKVTGIPPEWAGRGIGLCAIGSVIKYAREGSRVWGSGTPNSRDTLAAGAHYHAVRGPLTRDLVIANGGTCPEVYGDPAPALKSLDRAGRVIYIGSFSKSLFPGLRIGYMVAPAPLIARARALRAIMLRHPPNHLQRITAYFLALGHYDAHIVRLRGALKRRRALMEEALAATPLRIAGAARSGGSSLWIEGPEGIDSSLLATRLQADSVLIEPGEVFFETPPAPCRFFRLGYSSIREGEIAPGIALIARRAMELAAEQAG